MRLKTAPWKGNEYPGPGSYSPRGELDSVGVYKISKFSDSRATKIGPLSKKVPVNPPEAVSPGPGAYSTKPFLSQTGQYFLQGYENSRCRTFSKASRRLLCASTTGTVQIETPGPGSYNLTSEFGPMSAKLGKKQVAVHSKAAV